MLIVGMLGVLTLLTGALRTTAANNERVAATNLARELIEGTRGLDYDDMTGGLVQSRLQARGLGSGSTWTIERRGVTYTITATSCTYDDPADRLAATPPAAICTPQPAGTGGDSNGDDFRRTTFQIAWRESGGAQRSVSQTTLIVSPSGGLGPRIGNFTPVTQTISMNVHLATVVWTTTPAQTLRWAVDDGTSEGTSTAGTGTSTSFTTAWDIGNSGSTGEILDGSYQITAQPFDDRAVAGEAKRANVVLNRRQPYAPPSLVGGHNTRVGHVVDLEWKLNSERDILGYRAVWAGADGTVGSGDDARVCPAAAGDAILEPTTTSCADPSPPNGATKYYVVAVDRAPDNQLRDGDRRTLSIGAPSGRPGAPIALAVTSLLGQPLLTWLPPLLQSVSFYRIYRDGARYDVAPGGALTFTDSNPGNVGHEYRVAAVNSSYNESALSAPLISLP